MIISEEIFKKNSIPSGSSLFITKGGGLCPCYSTHSVYDVDMTKVPNSTSSNINNYKYTNYWNNIHSLVISGVYIGEYAYTPLPIGEDDAEVDVWINIGKMKADLLIGINSYTYSAIFGEFGTLRTLSLNQRDTLDKYIVNETDIKYQISYSESISGGEQYLVNNFENVCDEKKILSFKFHTFERLAIDENNPTEFKDKVFQKLYDENKGTQGWREGDMDRYYIEYYPSVVTPDNFLPTTSLVNTTTPPAYADKEGFSPSEEGTIFPNFNIYEDANVSKNEYLDTISVESQPLNSVNPGRDTLIVYIPGETPVEENKFIVVLNGKIVPYSVVKTDKPIINSQGERIYKRISIENQGELLRRNFRKPNLFDIRDHLSDDKDIYKGSEYEAGFVDNDDHIEIYYIDNVKYEVLQRDPNISQQQLYAPLRYRASAQINDRFKLTVPSKFFYNTVADREINKRIISDRNCLVIRNGQILIPERDYHIDEGERSIDLFSQPTLYCYDQSFLSELTSDNIDMRGNQYTTLRTIDHQYISSLNDIVTQIDNTEILYFYNIGSSDIGTSVDICRQITDFYVNQPLYGNLLVKDWTPSDIIVGGRSIHNFEHVLTEPDGNNSNGQKRTVLKKRDTVEDFLNTRVHEMNVTTSFGKVTLDGQILDFSSLPENIKNIPLMSKELFLSDVLIGEVKTEGITGYVTVGDVLVKHFRRAIPTSTVRMTQDVIDKLNNDNEIFFDDGGNMRFVGIRLAVSDNDSLKSTDNNLVDYLINPDSNMDYFISCTNGLGAKRYRVTTEDRKYLEAISPEAIDTIYQFHVKSFKCAYSAPDWGPKGFTSEFDGNMDVVPVTILKVWENVEHSKFHYALFIESFSVNNTNENGVSDSNVINLSFNNVIDGSGGCKAAKNIFNNMYYSMKKGPLVDSSHGGDLGSDPNTKTSDYIFYKTTLRAITLTNVMGGENVNAPSYSYHYDASYNKFHLTYNRIGDSVKKTNTNIEVIVLNTGNDFVNEAEFIMIASHTNDNMLLKSYHKYIAYCKSKPNTDEKGGFDLVVASNDAPFLRLDVNFDPSSGGSGNWNVFNNIIKFDNKLFIETDCSEYSGNTDRETPYKLLSVFDLNKKETIDSVRLPYSFNSGYIRKMGEAAVISNNFFSERNSSVVGNWKQFMMTHSKCKVGDDAAITDEDTVDLGLTWATGIDDITQRFNNGSCIFYKNQNENTYVFEKTLFSTVTIREKGMDSSETTGCLYPVKIKAVISYDGKIIYTSYDFDEINKMVIGTSPEFQELLNMMKEFVDKNSGGSTIGIGDDQFGNHLYFTQDKVYLRTGEIRTEIAELDVAKPISVRNRVYENVPNLIFTKPLESLLTNVNYLRNYFKPQIYEETVRSLDPFYGVDLYRLKFYNTGKIKK